MKKSRLFNRFFIKATSKNPIFAILEKEKNLFETLSFKFSRYVSKKCAAVLLASFMCVSIFAADLFISQDDLRLEKDDSGGYHLFVRKKPDVSSILLCETTKDPEGKSASYAYRAEKYNEINGDEKRMLNGEFLVSEVSKYSLIDSTEEKDAVFGFAFHVFIPEKILWGYPWARSGEVEIGEGTFVNIRTFEKKYADYSGGYSDNPFMFDFMPTKTVLTDDYNIEAAKAFEEIADSRDGKITYSRGPDTIVDDIMKSILSINPKDDVDVVFAIDTTGSMKDDMDVLRKQFVPRLLEQFKEFSHLRLGLLLYRDYGDNYKYKDLPVKFFDFTDNPETFKKQLNSFKILGTEGGDIPEAVYEALYASINFYKWNEKAEKKIILIGDAEPHPRPRGTKIKCTKEMVQNMAKNKNIVIDAIITPDDKAKRRK